MQKEIIIQNTDITKMSDTIINKFESLRQELSQKIESTSTNINNQFFNQNYLLKENADQLNSCLRKFITLLFSQGFKGREISAERLRKESVMNILDYLTKEQMLVNSGTQSDELIRVQ